MNANQRKDLSLMREFLKSALELANQGDDSSETLELIEMDCRRAALICITVLTQREFPDES